MAKTKDVRITISLECTSCSQDNEKNHPGVFRYTTQKNRRNTPTRIELKKFCPYCYRRTICREIKK